MDPRSHATTLLKNHLEKIDPSLQKEAAFAYHDSMQMKVCGMTPESQDYTHQERVFLAMLLMKSCISLLRALETILMSPNKIKKC